MVRRWSHSRKIRQSPVTTELALQTAEQESSHRAQRLLEEKVRENNLFVCLSAVGSIFPSVTRSGPYRWVSVVGHRLPTCRYRWAGPLAFCNNPDIMKLNLKKVLGFHGFHEFSTTPVWSGRTNKNCKTVNKGIVRFLTKQICQRHEVWPDDGDLPDTRF